MSKLQIKYDTLCTVAIEQLFYRNKVCRQYRVSPVLDLDVMPIAGTSDLMKRMDMVFRRTDENGGIIVLVRVDGSNGAGNDILRFPALPSDKLTFGVFLKNPGVLAQNDLPVEISGDQIYYFSNEIDDDASPRDNLHLSQDANGVAAGDLIPIATMQYRYHIPEVPAPDQVVVKHLLTGKTVVPVSVVPHEGEADLFFNLVSLPSGKCSLSIGGTEKTIFYYTGSSLKQLFFAVIEIKLSDAINSNYRAIEPDRSLSEDRPSYLITFKNRKTVWRYTFQLYPSSPLYLEMAALSPAEKAAFEAGLNVVSNDAAVTFKQTAITDNTLVFESQSAVALQEAYFTASSPPLALKLALEKNIGGPQESVVKDNLPYPFTQLIDVTPSSVYSDIFITI